MAEKDYERAFYIACALLNGTDFYGIDADKIFEICMDKDGVVTEYSYRDYILNHLDEIDHGEYIKIEKRHDMGIVRNEMTIIHDWNKDRIEKLRQDAIQTFKYEDMISPIMTSFINNEYTFVINGDCSKVGWDVSEQFHDIRMKWCEKHKYDAQNIVVINFGEDDIPCYIVFDNTRPHTESEE